MEIILKNDIRLVNVKCCGVVGDYNTHKDMFMPWNDNLYDYLLNNSDEELLLSFSPINSENTCVNCVSSNDIYKINGKTIY